MTRTLQLVGLCLFIGAFAPISRADISLYSDEGEFHGCLDCARYDDDSICNPYGDYGSSYGDKSIWNRYGAGSSYKENSPFNRYGKGMKMVDEDGDSRGRFSISHHGRISESIPLQRAWDAAGGDYSRLRDEWCR